MLAADDQLTVFVKSASISIQDGGGYAWQPGQPEFARRIEAEARLVSDYFPQMVLWGRWDKGVGEGTRYGLYTGALSSPHLDSHGRQIKNTLVWCGGKGAQDQLRGLMLAFLRGALAPAVSLHIQPRAGRGFDCAEQGLLVLAKSLARDGSLTKAPPGARDYSQEELIGLLETHVLPTCKRLDFHPSGPLVVAGKGFSLKSLAKVSGSDQLRWACDLDLRGEE